jgi:hypothetical protein
MSGAPVRVSVVCGCMDRNQMLAEALPSWLALPEIGEVVIVDWSSPTPVRLLTTPLRDPRVKVIRVEGQSRWIASKSHNLGARAASGEVLLRLDCDYVLGPSFFETHKLSPRTFFCGNWRRARVDNERHLTGVLYLHKPDFLGANGYNERIVTYGYEDDDLFERLERAGLTRRNIDLDTIHHIPHDDMMRTRHQDVGSVEYETERNKILAHKQPWSAADRMTSWERRETGDGETVYVEALHGGAGAGS